MKRLSAGILLALLSLPARADEILVFAAASLAESMQEIGKAFEARTGTAARFSLGASSDLARQIRAGAPADVFFSADTTLMDEVEKAGLVRKEDRREFLTNVLVVVVPKSSTLRITDARDLAALPRIAVADPAAVPAGKYAKKWLESLGLWAKIEPKVVPALDVRSALAAVASGALPAGIVYKTDAAIAPDVRVALIARDGPRIVYSVSRTSASRSPAARTFVEFTAGNTGRAVFERRGFVVQPRR
ncbi:MAG TPA: molybdate ABC transporter substrate-binding protein [Thermoanaerobaculia bacterium]